MSISLTTKNIPASNLGDVLSYLGTDMNNIETLVNANETNIATNTANITTGVTNNVTFTDYKNFEQLPGYSFDGATSFIFANNLVAQMIQTWNTQGAMMIDFVAPNTLAAGTLFSGNDTSADEHISIKLTAAGKIQCQCTVAATAQWDFITDDVVIEPNKRYGIMLVHNGTVPYLYINKTTPDITFSVTTDQTAWFAVTTAVDNFRVMCDNVAGAGNANFVQGNVYRVLALTDVPTLAEAYALNMGGVVPWKWRGASTAQHLDETDFATHAKWDVTNDWDDTGGNGAFTWSANQTSTLTQQDTNRLSTGKSGQRFLFKYVCAVTAAPDGDLAVTITNAFADTAVSLEFTAGTKYARFLSAAGCETADFVISAVSGTDTAGTFTYDDVSLIHIGAVMDLNFNGMGHKQWHDTDSAVFVTMNSTEFFNVPSGHKEVVLMDAIGSDTSGVIVPAGYRLDSIIVQETAGNAITGGLKIGTAAGGTQVVNAQAVGGNALVDCTLASNIFSLSATQTLYIEDVTAWNSAVIDLYFVMSKLF